MEKVNVIHKFELFQEHWDPKIVGELNGQQVKLVKLLGKFIWHLHENEDELFYVVKGKFVMHFRSKEVEVGENEFLIVPKGIEHKPEAADEVWLMLFEPKSTINTGNVNSELTKRLLERM